MRHQSCTKSSYSDVYTAIEYYNNGEKEKGERQWCELLKTTNLPEGLFFKFNKIQEQMKLRVSQIVLDNEDDNVDEEVNHNSSEEVDNRSEDGKLEESSLELTKGMMPPLEDIRTRTANLESILSQLKSENGSVVLKERTIDLFDSSLNTKKFKKYKTDLQIVSQDGKGNTPLHILLRDKERVDCLLEDLILRGASINSQNDLGETPLHIAAKKGHSLKIRKLLYWGADPDIKDTRKRKALDLVEKNVKSVQKRLCKDLLEPVTHRES